MKVLKIVLLFLVVMTNTSFVFIPKPTETKSVKAVYQTVVYIPWGKSGSGYWTLSKDYNRYNDFDMMVSRSSKRINGYYYYDIWLYSQSYYWVNRPEYVSTNITNCKVIVNNQTIIHHKNPLGITFMNEYNPSHLRFRAVSSTPSVWLSWGHMKGI